MKQKQKHPLYPERGSVEDLDHYDPVYFTHPSVEKESQKSPYGWADPFWNTLNEKQKVKILSRVPMAGPFENNVYKQVDERDFDYSGPLNPKGRTGMIGRGLLGNYGPNYAADPIVTRFNKGILEMVAIKRGDTGEWAIPGGMVEKGTTVSATLKNEFNQEALGNVGNTHESEKTVQDSEYTKKIEKIKKDLDILFSNGTKVYEGHVDDPRNTDWAWMETVAVHFHIEDGSPLHNIELRAATDAIGACWYPLNEENINKLYASHSDFVRKVIERI